MSAADQTDEALPAEADAPQNAQFLACIALAAGLIREATSRALATSDPQAAIALAGQVIEHSDTIQDVVRQMMVALDCGPETFEAAKDGLKRIGAFRACQGLEGNA